VATLSMVHARSWQGVVNNPKHNRVRRVASAPPRPYLLPGVMSVTVRRARGTAPLAAHPQKTKPMVVYRRDESALLLQMMKEL